MPIGRVLAIHTAPSAGASMETHDAIEAIAGRGLAGDRYCEAVGSYSGQRRPDHERAITLIEAETLDAVRAEHGIDLPSDRTRRNIVTRGIALNDLVGVTFRVGEVTLRGVDLAHPCAYLEGLTQPGVLGALKNRGGVRAEILTGATTPGGPQIAGRPGAALLWRAALAPTSAWGGQSSRGTAKRSV